jgi:hypothetical protein
VPVEAGEFVETPVAAEGFEQRENGTAREPSFPRVAFCMHRES